MERDKQLTDEFRKRAELQGAREIKIVSAEFLKDSQGLYGQITGMLPGVNSVISFSFPLPKGSLHILKTAAKGFPYYTRLASMGMRAVDELSIKLSVHLEEKGFDAVPVFTCTPLETMGKLDFRGYVSHIDIAAKSGVGWKGKNGLLISPRSGPRILVGTVLTDAFLEEEKPTSAGKCPDNCFICVEKCPAKALDGTGKVDRPACTQTQGIAPLSSMMAKDFPVKEHAEMIVNFGAVDEHTWYKCNSCVVECPIGL